MATYLVTGGAGFIGSHLSERLLQDGNDVVCVDDLNSFYDPAIKERNIRDLRTTAVKAGTVFNEYRGDIREVNKLRSIFDHTKIDGVFHLAAWAGVRPSIKNPALYWSVNCTGTSHLLTTMREFGVKRFVFASSSSVYGKNNTVPFNEEMDVGQPISPYGATKRAGELLCHTFSHLDDIHTICIRFFTVYGPRQRPDLAIHKFARLIQEGKPIPFFGDGSSQRDYTYISDIVEGVVAAMKYADTCAYDILNLGESNTISLAEMVSLLEKKLGKSAKLDRQPAQPGDMDKTWADISKARRVLGYEPKVGKEEGFERFVEWFRGA